MPVDRRDLVSPNSEALPTELAPAHIRLQGAKSSKAMHLHNKVKKQALRANAKAMNDFVAATLKKAEQIAQQNTFSLFTLEDRLITSDLARQWLHLRRTQELAKLKAEVVASNAPAPPLVRVFSSPGNTTPSCEQQTPPISASISPPPAPAPAPTQTHHQGLGTQTQHQGLGFKDLNHVVDAADAANNDDCAELDDEDDVFLDSGYEVVLLTDMRMVSDHNSFGNDFSQAASDREEDTIIILDSKVSEFQINPPPSQR